MKKIIYLPGITPGMTIDVSNSDGFSKFCFLDPVKECNIINDEYNKFLFDKQESLKKQLESYRQKVKDLILIIKVMKAAGHYDQELIEEHELTLKALTGLFELQGITIETYESEFSSSFAPVETAVA